jgi:TPR repeat protein
MDSVSAAFLVLGMMFAPYDLGAPERGPKPAITPVEFVFDNRVNHTKDLPTAALQAARKRMVTGQKISTSDLRALADHGDGLAAFRFARMLQGKTPPPKRGVAAHYYAISAYTGRHFAVPELVRLLVAEGAGYSDNLLSQCLNALTIQAISGNAKAALALGQMYADGQPFGRDLAESQRFLALAGQSDPAAALKLGLALMGDPADAALNHAGARAALTLAAGSTDLSARITAENLLNLLDAPQLSTAPTPPTSKAAP